MNETIEYSAVIQTDQYTGNFDAELTAALFGCYDDRVRQDSGGVE